ncbi:MAG: hypothetical protein GY832_19375 [Chloroflexi bacterium]|nr:hypothetical protein [Chloroflexota bacterium]
MRKSNLFWAVILIIAGTLLLLNNLGILNIDVWGLIWPLFLIVLGAATLWGVFFGGSSIETEEATISLEGAAQAHILVKHGAGRLFVDNDASPGELLSGTFGGGLEQRVKRNEDALDVEMSMPSRSFVFPWAWGSGETLNWSFGLNSEIPITLKFNTGAGEAQLDLTDLQVTDLRVSTGASSTDVTLPANAGHTKARIDSGAASVTVRIPSGVAARIRAGGGLASVNVDRNRFPREGGVYQSPDYETASNKVDLKIDTGVGSIYVH